MLWGPETWRTQNKSEVSQSPSWRIPHLYLLIKCILMKWNSVSFFRCNNIVPAYVLSKSKCKVEIWYFLDFLCTVSKWILNTMAGQSGAVLDANAVETGRCGRISRPWHVSEHCSGISGGERAHKELSRLTWWWEENQKSRRDLRHLGQMVYSLWL